MSGLPERFRVNTEEVAAKVIDGEAIIINLTTGVYYSMDGVGARNDIGIDDDHVGSRGAQQAADRVGHVVVDRAGVRAVGV